MNIELIRVDEDAEDPWFAAMRQQINHMNAQLATARARLESRTKSLNEIRAGLSLSPMNTSGITYPMPAIQGLHPAYFIYDELDDGEPAPPIYGFWKSLFLDIRDGLVAAWKGWFG